MFKNERKRPTSRIEITASTLTILEGVRLVVEKALNNFVHVDSVNVFLTSPRRGLNAKLQAYIYRTAKVEVILVPDLIMISIKNDLPANIWDGSPVKAVFHFTVYKAPMVKAPWYLSEFENFAKIGNDHAKLVRFWDGNVTLEPLPSHQMKDIDFSFTR